LTIRVLLVEDAPVVLLVLKRMLANADGIDVIGTASNGKEALDLIPRLNPDVICTDLHMPEMDGWALTSEVMQRFPRPILVLSASVQASDTENVFRVLDAGAVDVLAKPVGGVTVDREILERELLEKIRILSGVVVFSRHGSPVRTRSTSSPTSTPSLTPLTHTPPNPSKTAGYPATDSQQVRSSSPSTVSPKLTMKTPTIPILQRPPSRILAIGASTGGPQALSTILAALPANFPIPILCTQHISQGFLGGLVRWLNADCAVTVQIAQAGERAQNGHVYFAPETAHLTIDRSGILRCLRGDLRDGHCPSVTALFESVAQSFGHRATGVLLTGMGRDGAAGLLAMARQGAMTIAQDESSCVVFGMPKEAIALEAAQHILPLHQIAATVMQQFAATA
jgi:two-component system chemotaxis response regulator CheB